MAHFQEPRSPRALRSPPASPAKPAESPTSPTARKTAKRSLGETSPGGSRPPRPKRVNSYSELNFSSIVRVDSLGTMALPAFGEGGYVRIEHGIKCLGLRGACQAYIGSPPPSQPGNP